MLQTPRESRWVFGSHSVQTSESTEGRRAKPGQPARQLKLDADVRALPGFVQWTKKKTLVVSCMFAASTSMSPSMSRSAITIIAVASEPTEMALFASSVNDPMPSFKNTLLFDVSTFPKEDRKVIMTSRSPSVSRSPTKVEGIHDDEGPVACVMPKLAANVPVAVWKLPVPSLMRTWACPPPTKRSRSATRR